MNGDQLLPCPFCGGHPAVIPWHGGPPTKRLIECDNETCDVNPSVTGKTFEIARQRWNRRVPA